jgi:excisionase family DNA binding protein
MAIANSHSPSDQKIKPIKPGSHCHDTRNFLTTKEVAQYLRVNQYTVYRLVSQKKLPAYKVGSQWRFKRSVLDHWLKTQLNTSATH